MLARERARARQRALPPRPQLAALREANERIAEGYRIALERHPVLFIALVAFTVSWFGSFFG